jgi:hypothetical protein
MLSLVGRVGLQRRRVAAGPASTAPANTVLPSITGDTVPGALIGLDIGVWTGADSYSIRIFDVSSGGSSVFGPYDPDGPAPTDIDLVLGETYWIEVTATGPGGSTTVRATTGFGPIVAGESEVVAYGNVIQGTISSASATIQTNLDIPAEPNRACYAVASFHKTATTDGTETFSAVTIGGNAMTLIGEITGFVDGTRSARYFLYGALHGSVPAGGAVTLSATRSVSSANILAGIQAAVLKNTDQTLLTSGDVVRAAGTATDLVTYSESMTMPADVLAIMFQAGVAGNNTADSVSLPSGVVPLGAMTKGSPTVGVGTLFAGQRDVTSAGSYTFGFTTTQSNRFGFWIVVPVPK